MRKNSVFLLKPFNYWKFFRFSNIASNDKIKIGNSCVVFKKNDIKLKKSFRDQYPGQIAS
jgi:hypothetical protein